MNVSYNYHCNNLHGLVAVMISLCIHNVTCKHLQKCGDADVNYFVICLVMFVICEFTLNKNVMYTVLFQSRIM